MKIVFVCTGNICRSPMAEYILKSKVKDVEVSSCGVSTFNDLSISKNALEALSELGIDAKDHKSKLINQEIIDNADYIFTMTGFHKTMIESFLDIKKGNVFTLSDSDVADPYGGDLDVYRNCRDELICLIDGIIDKLKLA